MDVPRDVRSGVVEEHSAKKRSKIVRTVGTTLEDQDSDFLAQQKVSGQAVLSHWTGWRVS
jgi:hypothetical protein